MKRRKKNKNNDVNNVKSGLKLQEINPLNANQRKAIEAWQNGDNMILLGAPGTGKTFLAVYLMLEDIMNNNLYPNGTIVRSTVSSRDMGFLKGGPTEKAAVYEKPYKTITSELFERDDAYEILKSKKILEFVPTAFERGNTRDSIMLLDECQNMDYMELHTLITRLGDYGRIILCGDFDQDDLTSERYNTKSGFKDIVNILKRVPNTSIINFGIDDIVRGQYIKDYLIAKLEYEKNSSINI